MDIMITLKNNTSIEKIDKYIQLGANIIRFNFSHIDKNWVKKTVVYIKNKYPQVKVLQDLQGCKIRILKDYKYNVKVEKDKKVCFCNEKFYLEHLFKVPYILVPISWKKDFKLLYDAKKIIIGNNEFKKLSFLNENAFLCVSTNECILRAEKGVNFINLDRQKLLYEDEDVINILEMKDIDFDYICLSFVEQAKALKEIKNIMSKNNIDAKLIAKIETLNGFLNFDDILTECDGILLGRGDLSKETNSIDFFNIQKDIIKKMELNDKKLIIGTYIFQGMIKNNKPSVSDLTAIEYFLEHKVDSLMLSDEIVVGLYPQECIELLKKIINNI